MKQNHQMGHRETTAWELAARLTEVLLQLGGVRHGATRTIHDEDPMAEPATFVVDVRPPECGRSVSAMRRSKRWKTPRGSRWRALQKAEPVKDSPLLWGRSFSGVLWLRIWRMNKWIVLAGVNNRFLQEKFSSRQAALIASLSRRVATSCPTRRRMLTSR